MRVVLDSTVLVCLALSGSERFARLRNYLRAGYFTVLSTSKTLLESGDALIHPSVASHHKLADDTVDDLCELFAQEAIIPNETPSVCFDRHYDKFLACAIAGKADFIVSDTKSLLDMGSYKGVRFITVHALLTRLDVEAQATT